ncbi:MAG: BMP family ABC transporter substrate-binding protein [Myxococcales bacterium]|nr:BMP family ABC transporter substrate-binding protein [Myxococcales bacterium]
MQKYFWPFSLWLMFGAVLLGGLLRPSRHQDAQSQKKLLKVGLVLSVGGRGDQSFNDSAYKGLQEAARLFRGVMVRFSEPRENAAARHDLENFAKQGFDLIIGVGFLMARAVEDVAKQYPRQHFAIIDAIVKQPNVASLVFQEHEGSYLAGVLAALATRTSRVAFMGGMDVPLIRKFGAGFRQGVLDTKPHAKVLIGYLSASPKGFHDPDGGEKMAQTFFGQGADIIFHAAGSSGHGAIKAARTWNARQKDVGKKRYIIGVDGNQDGMAPGSVLTSMIKRVNVAVFESIKLLLLGHFEARTYRYGLAEAGVGVTDCRYALDRLPKNFASLLQKRRLAIIQGKIRVSPVFPDNMQSSPAKPPQAPSSRPVGARP